MRTLIASITGHAGPAAAGRPILLLALLAALLAAPAARADDFDSAMRALEQRDYAAALEQFGRAAEGGDADAQYMLGRLYANGIGVLQNFVDAYHWYSLAAAQGQRFAIPTRDVLAERMTAAQIAAAQDRAAQTQAAGAADNGGGGGGGTDDETLLTQIQLGLKRLGYGVGAINGQLDGDTQSAIMSYQADNRLVIDGRPSAALLERLTVNDDSVPRIRRSELPADDRDAEEPPPNQVDWRKLL